MLLYGQNVIKIHFRIQVCKDVFRKPGLFKYDGADLLHRILNGHQKSWADE